MRKIIFLFAMILNTLVIFGEEYKIVTDSALVSRLCYDLEIPLIGVPISRYPMPDEYKNITKIGRAASPDYEKIIEIGANKVISTTFIKASTQKKYKELGIESDFLNIRSYEDTKNTIEYLGNKYGSKEKTKKILNDIKKREKNILKNIDTKNKKYNVAIVYNINNKLSLAGKNHFISSLLKILNCNNVTEKIENKYLKKNLVPLDLEGLISLNPDIILKIPVGKSKEILNDKFFEGTTAYKNKKIYVVDPYLLRMSPGIKCIDSLEKLYSYIYKQ